MQLRDKHHSYVVLAVLKVSVSAKWNKFQHEHTNTQTPALMCFVFVTVS